METFAHFDESFNLNKTSTYNLTLHFSKDYYAYVLKDTIRKQFVAIKKGEYPEQKRTLITDKIKDAIKSDVYLNKSYKSVDIVFRSNKFTLVPTAIFNKQNIKTYFNFNNEIKPEDEIHFNKLNETQAVNLFVVPSAITTFLVNKFPEVKFFQHSSNIIELLIAESKKSNSEYPTFYINFSRDDFDIIAVKKGQLLFYNNFYYKTCEDYLFYFLNVIRNMEYNNDKIDVILSGEITPKMELYLNSYKYFANYKFAQVMNNFTYNFEVAEHILSNILY